MMSIKNLVAIMVVFVSVACVSDTADAQRSRFRLNQAFRYLGAGQAAGYHWRTPGPLVGYYNPYSHHNSALRIGGSPQGAPGCYSYQPRLDYGNFNQPSSLGRFGGPAVQKSVIAPAQYNSIDSELDTDQYENDEPLNDEEAEETEQSILDEIEALDRKSGSGTKNIEGGGSSNKDDGAALWSDVFELSRVQIGPPKKSAGLLRRRR